MRSTAVAKIALAGALAAGLIAAGCGDDDDGDAAASISKEEWIAQADEICAEGDKEIARQASEFFGGKEPKPDDTARFSAEVVAPEVAGQVEEIEALGAPDGDEDQVEAILAAANDGVTVLEEGADNPDEALTEAIRLMGDGRDAWIASSQRYETGVDRMGSTINPRALTSGLIARSSLAPGGR